jgi:hypothetical protein
MLIIRISVITITTICARLKKIELSVFGMLDRKLLLLAVALCLVPAPHRPWLAYAAIAAENTGDMIEGGVINNVLYFRLFYDNTLYV